MESSAEQRLKHVDGAPRTGCGRPGCACGLPVGERFVLWALRQWQEDRAEEKFDRVLSIGKELAKTRASVAEHLALDGMPLERAAATAVRLLDLGYFRIGSDAYADENGSFGLTTLERRHVRRDGGRLVFSFVGKSGVEHEIEIDDALSVASV